MDDFLSREVLDHRSLACGLAAAVGGKLSANGRIGGSGIDYEKIFLSAFRAEPTLCTSVASDMLRFKEVDPACPGLLAVYLFYKGVHAMACARVSGYYWRRRGEAGKLLARLLQSEGSDMYGVDIHPGARLGNGITIDHATGVVIGETSVIGDNVYLMHDVTLGATGTSDEHDRHPKIGAGVAHGTSSLLPKSSPCWPHVSTTSPVDTSCLAPRACSLVVAHGLVAAGTFLGAKCTVLGNIQVGEGATVAAQALVNKPVPPGYTAVGVPAKLLPPPQESKYWKPPEASLASRKRLRWDPSKAF